MLTNLTVGTKVRIVTDCRPGTPATGQIATYDGDLPRSIIYVDRGAYAEYTLEEWDASPLKATARTKDDVEANLPADPEPQPIDYPTSDGDDDVFREWWQARNDWLRRNGIAYYFTHTNPRLSLADGSVIWGDECWWSPIEP